MRFTCLFIALVCIVWQDCVVADGELLELRFDRYYTSEAKPGGLHRRDPITAPLLNGNVLYYANVTVGTPPQQLRLLLDTGSSDIWVLGMQSTLCRFEPSYCSQSGTYATASSSSFKKVSNNFDIQYGDGTYAQGIYATDTVGIGGQSFTGVQFGVGLQTTSQEGVLGIGYAANQALVATGMGKSYDTLLQHMKSTAVIASQSYSLWLNDVDAPTGSILFGGINTAKYNGTLWSMPLDPSDGSANATEFYVTLTGMALTNAKSESASISMDPIPVLLDSGTSYIYLPKAVLNQVLQNIPATYNSQLGIYILPDCSLRSYAGTVDFRFSDLTIRVPLDNIIVPGYYAEGDPITFSNGQQACLLSILDNSQTGVAILGDTFLRSAYVVYDLDNQRVAMAQTVFNTTESNVVAISSGIPSASSVSAVSLAATASGVRPGIAGPRTSQGMGGVMTSTAAAPSGIFSDATSTHKGKASSARGSPNWSLTILIWTTAVAAGICISML